MKNLQCALVITLLLFFIDSTAQSSGCLDIDACNFNSTATLNDGSCFYAEQWFIPIDVDLDNQPAILSCSSVPDGYVLADKCAMDQLVADDPYCINNTFDLLCLGGYNALLFEVNGCTDSEACNYSVEAICDNGCCTYPKLYLVHGETPFYSCTQPDFYRTIEANECCLSIVNPDYMTTDWLFFGESDFREDYIDCMNGSFSDGSEVIKSRGCSDISACNYSEFPCVEEECIYDLSYRIYMPSEFPRISVECVGQTESDYGSFWIELENKLCAQKIVDEFMVGTVTFWGIDRETAYNECLCSFGGCTDVLACNYDSSIYVDDGSCAYAGCNDPLAINYNADAGCINDSCIYGGCTYAGASNYDSEADVDDGSCILMTEAGCVGDLNTDGAVTSADLNLFLAVFGNECD